MKTGGPIKIFVINNGGYHSIRQSHKLFRTAAGGYRAGKRRFGVSVHGEAGICLRRYRDLKCENNAELGRFLGNVFDTKGAVIAEVIVSPEQKFEPKSATKKLPDGTLVSAPLENLAPFLPEEENRKKSLIKLGREVINMAKRAVITGGTSFIGRYGDAGP